MVISMQQERGSEPDRVVTRIKLNDQFSQFQSPLTLFPFLDDRSESIHSISIYNSRSSAHREVREKD